MVPIPSFSEDKSSLDSIECKALSALSQEEKIEFGLDHKDPLANCEITVLENNKVICYRCLDEYFFDGNANKCRKREEYSTMEGCEVSYDNVHCVFCQDDKQFDFTSGKCISKDHKIDMTKLNSQMGFQYQDYNEVVEGKNEDLLDGVYDRGQESFDEDFN